MKNALWKLGVLFVLFLVHSILVFQYQNGSGLMAQSLSGLKAVELKIGLLADVQFCACEAAGAREYEKSAGKLEEAVQVMNRSEVNFTVEVGDLIDRDFASFEPISRIMNSLHSRWVFVPGNHDFNVPDSLKKRVWKMIPSKKGYRSEVIGDIRMVYLNGFENSVIAYKKGSKEHKDNKGRLADLEKAKAKNASDWNGGLGKKQLKWIKTEVEKASRANQKLIVFGHQPIIPGEEHSMWDSKKLIEILNGFKHQVLYICGHKHSGGDTTIGKIRIINLKGMVEQPTASYAVLTVYPDRWEIKGYGEETSKEGRWK